MCDDVIASISWICGKIWVIWDDLKAFTGIVSGSFSLQAILSLPLLPFPFLLLSPHPTPYINTSPDPL